MTDVSDEYVKSGMVDPDDEDEESCRVEQRKGEESILNPYDICDSRESLLSALIGYRT